MTKNKELLLTVSEVARLLFVFESYVYTLIRAGKLPASKVEGVWMIKKSDADAYAERLAVRRGKAAEKIA